MGGPFFDALENICQLFFISGLVCHFIKVLCIPCLSSSNKGPVPSPQSFPRWLLLNATVCWLEALWAGEGVGLVPRGREWMGKRGFCCSPVAIQPQTRCPQQTSPSPPESGICQGLGVLGGEARGARMLRKTNTVQIAARVKAGFLSFFLPVFRSRQP